MSVFNSVPPKINKIHLINWLKSNFSNFNKKNINLKELSSERDKNYLLLINKKPKYVIAGYP